MPTVEPLSADVGQRPANGSRNGDRPLTDELLRGFGALFDTSSHGYAVFMDGVIVYANSRLADMMGYALSDLEGRRPDEFVAPQDRERLANGIDRLLAGGEDEAAEYLVLRKDGCLLPVEAISQAARVGGKPAIFSLVRDITARKRADAARQERERLYRTLFDNHIDGVVLTVDGRIVQVNPSFEQLSGYTAEETHGRPPSDFFVPEERERVANRVRTLLEKGPEYPSEYHQLRRDGSTLPVEILSRAIDYAGRPAILSVVRDVTARKLMEEALRESEDRFRRLAENAQDMIFRYRMTEPAGFEYVSPAAEAIAGYAPERYYEDPDFVLDVIHRKDREKFDRMVLDRITEPVELRWIRSDGSTMWTEQCNTYVYDDAGALVAVEGIVRDITERKRMEAALQMAREELEGTVERQLQRKNPYGLTFRELTILNLVAVGRADKEIAVELGISPLTVHKHVANILGKMDVACRTGASTRAIREGLLD